MILTHRQALCGAFRDPVVKARDALQNGWQARADVTPHRLDLPIDWLADPFQDRNWRFQLNAWRPLDVMVTAHSQSGDDIWLERLVERMIDWAAFEADHSSALELWNDMGSGLRAAKLAYVISQPGFARPQFDDRRIAVVDLARRHLARLRDKNFIGDSNHGLFQVHGTMALAKVMPDVPEAEGAEAYAEDIFNSLLDRQFCADGMHLEHSPGYHLFALKTVERLLASGWYDGMGHVQDVVTLARDNLRWLTFPDGCLSAIGDSGRTPVTIRRRPAPAGGISAKLFQHAGYAVVRTTRGTPAAESSMLLVTGAHHSNVHKHADELSFELYDRGRFVIVDTGKYTYSKKAWRDFTDGASAHNAVDLIAERTDNGVRRTAPAGNVLTRLGLAPWGWVIEGAIDRPGWGVSHHRTFLYRPGEWLVLLDRIAATEPREVTAWLHLAPELTARRSGAGFVFDGGAVTYAASCPFALTRQRGVIEPRIQGWVSTGYHRRQANDALGLTAVGAGLSLASVISLDPAVAPQVSFNADQANVAWGDQLLIAANAIQDRIQDRSSWSVSRAKRALTS